MGKFLAERHTAMRFKILLWMFYVFHIIMTHQFNTIVMITQLWIVCHKTCFLCIYNDFGRIFPNPYWFQDWNIVTFCFDIGDKLMVSQVHHSAVLRIFENWIRIRTSNMDINLYTKHTMKCKWQVSSKGIQMKTSIRIQGMKLCSCNYLRSAKLEGN